MKPKEARKTGTFCRQNAFARQNAFVRPPAIAPGEQVTVVGRVFGTPLVVKGLTWLPVTQLIVSAIMAWLAGRRRPERTWGQRFGVGALSMAVLLGSEWCHNLAHAAAARLVGKPMDALRVNWGMPLVVYHDIEDPDVTPRQHIARALGGPVFNLLLLALSLLWRRRTPPNSTAREVANTAVGMNTFLSTVSFLPIPGLDGGVLLKWSLVERGQTTAQADETVRVVNYATGAGLGLAGAAALKRRRWFLGGLLGLLAALSLAIATGLIKEKA